MSDEQGRNAAARAALELVEPNTVIGLGSGRAVFALAKAIGDRWQGEAPVQAVAASPETAKRAAEAGIATVELRGDTHLDVAFDGTDEVDGDLRLIKGGGAALLREKLVMAMAERVVIFAEQKKRVRRLGESRLLPIEIVPFGWETTQQRVSALAPAELRVDGAGSPIITADGNYLLEASLSEVSTDWAGFAGDLKSILGVVEHGLFLDQADQVILGTSDGDVEILHRRA